MKKIIAALLIILSSWLLPINSVSAQDYHFAIGGRWGKMNSGISAKYMFGAENNNGLQLELYRTFIYSRGYTVKLFYIREGEFRIPILQIPLDYIYGGGIHVGYFPYDPEFKSTYPGTLYCHYKKVGGVGQCVNYYKTVFSAGVDGTVQIEYRVPWQDLPLSVSIDANIWGLGQSLPFEFINKGAEWLDFGFTVRYCFTGK